MLKLLHEFPHKTESGRERQKIQNEIKANQSHCSEMNVHHPCRFFISFLLKIGFLCSFGACLGTLSVDLAGLELTEILLPLPPEYWN